MHAALVHQGARHDPVIYEVAGDKPVIRVDVRFGPDNADAAASPGRIELNDAMDEAHPVARNRQRPGQRQPGEQRPETTGQIAIAQSVELCRIVPFTRQGHQILPVSRADAGRGAQIQRGTDNTLAGVQFLLTEEPGAAVAHGQKRPAIHSGLEVEAKQPGIPLTEEPLDVDVVMDCFARSGQAAVKGDHGVEQPVDRKSSGNKVDTEIPGKEQVGLTGFHGNTGGDAAAVQIPGARMDVMFRNDPAVGHGAWFTLDTHDPVHQHERFIRQPDTSRETVDLGKFAAKHPAGRTAGEFETHVAVEGNVLAGGHFSAINKSRRSPIIPQRLHKRHFQGKSLGHRTGHRFGYGKERRMGFRIALPGPGQFTYQRIGGVVMGNRNSWNRGRNCR